MSLFQNSELSGIQEKIEHNERLTFEDVVQLFRSSDLPFLGRLAHLVRTRLHGKKVFYSVNFHMNHTNVCTAHCLFCAFARRPGESGGYTFSIEQIRDAVAKAIEKYRINEVHIVGGLNPDLDFDYYVSLFQTIRAA